MDLGLDFLGGMLTKWWTLLHSILSFFRVQIANSVLATLSTIKVSAYQLVQSTHFNLYKEFVLTVGWVKDGMVLAA